MYAQSESFELSGKAFSDDLITAICCIPIFKTSGYSINHNSFEICPTIGCRSGSIKVYNVSGQILFSHQPHNASIISIKFRTVHPKVDDLENEEEVILLCTDMTVVIMEGMSFSYASKSQQSDGELNLISGILFRKYRLQSNDSISDIISLGTNILIEGISTKSSLFPISFHPISSKINNATFMNRFLAAGNPLVSLYTTTEHAKANQISGNATSSAKGFTISNVEKFSPSQSRFGRPLVLKSLSIKIPRKARHIRSPQSPLTYSLPTHPGSHHESYFVHPRQ